ncbi:unnamed protein product, partial [Prorocentrum cordatum]
HAVEALGDPRGTEPYRRILAALNTKDSGDKIPYISRLGDRYYNFWRDAAHPQGVWRRTTLEMIATARGARSGRTSSTSISKGDQWRQRRHSTRALTRDGTACCSTSRRAGPTRRPCASSTWWRRLSSPRRRAASWCPRPKRA